MQSFGYRTGRTGCDRLAIDVNDRCHFDACARIEDFLRCHHILDRESFFHVGNAMIGAQLEHHLAGNPVQDQVGSGMRSQRAVDDD